MAALGMLDDLSEDELLDVAGSCAEAARRAEVDLLRVACQWAVLHAADRLDPAESARPGRERARRLGGPGTPEVTEFAAAELGARIGRSAYAAARLIGDALDLCHRHPQLWARVEAGEVRASYARHVVARTRDLESAEAAYVDAGVVESADGRIAWSRFEALVEAKVAQAAPEAAREREESAARATFARKIAGEAHGMATFLVRADVATIDTIEAAVAGEAERLDPGLPGLPVDVRRVRAVLQLLTGSATPSVEVQLFVHVYDGPDREAVARLEGHGPVSESWVRDVLGPHARFTIRPVLDLAGQAPVDAWEVPDRHRRAVHLMTPADTFPYATCTSRAMQLDHTIAFGEGGESGVGNYGPMTTSHHRIKTHGRWQVQQPFPGIYLWRDPHGATYLIDHTGTRRVPSAPTNRRPVVELWRSPVTVTYALAA